MHVQPLHPPCWSEWPQHAAAELCAWLGKEDGVLKRPVRFYRWTVDDVPRAGKLQGSGMSGMAIRVMLVIGRDHLLGGEHYGVLI